MLPHNTFDAYLFDLDGTLVDTERLYVQAAAQWLAGRGATLRDSDAMRIVYGRAWRDVFTDLKTSYPTQVPTLPEAEAGIRACVDALKEGEDIRIPSSIALLKRLAMTHPVAVVTGSGRKDATHHLALAGINGEIRFLLSSEDYPAGKPDPAPYRIAAERLGIDPAHCLVFEDSAAGVVSAKAAGMSVVALQRPDRPVQDVSLADWVVEDLGVIKPNLL